MERELHVPTWKRTPLPARRGNIIYMSLKVWPQDIMKCGYTQTEIEAFARKEINKHYKLLVRRLGGDPAVAADL